MAATNELSRTIVVIGGGVSGALTVLHLIRQKTPAQVILIDPRPALGLGLAYSTPSLRHLLNVPAGKISALSDQPDHFLNWFRRNYDASATEKTFAPRVIFGRYIQSLLATVSGFKQEIAVVTDLRTEKFGAVVTLDSGREIRANLVVLATGNFDPAPLPGIASDAVTKKLYFHNAWSEETYKKLPVHAPVAIIGTGLTAVDVVVRLRELGHRGKIIAISRHGIFPYRHQDYVPMLHSAIPLDTPATVVAYLRALRAAIRTGAEWRAAVDSLRATTNKLWLRLPIAEKRRFRRHLQRRWDVVRHRMAPPIADIIDAQIESGSLELREGYLASVDASPDGAHVVVRTHNGTEDFYVNRVINSTGPNMDYRRVSSALLQNLFGKCLVTAGLLGTGYHSDENGAVIDARGRISATIFSLGPGRLGDLIESIAVPEIRQQAFDLAATLNSQLPLPNTAASESRNTFTEATNGKRVAV